MRRLFLRQGSLAAAKSAAPASDLAAAPWVSVDDEGQPAKTVTPSLTTISGTPSVVEGAAPHDLIASVYTWTTWGAVTTSTGAPPNPTATDAQSGAGAFPRCFHRDGEGAPFCWPRRNATLLTGTTYYVVWDPDFYPRDSNASSHDDHNKSSNRAYEVAIRIDFLNQTDKQKVKLDTYDRVPARWGYWPFRLTDAHLQGYRVNQAFLTLLASVNGSEEKHRSAELPIQLTRPPLDHSSDPTPDRTALLVVLPIGLAVFFGLLVGLCLWHRKTRRIDLAGLVARAGRRRRGYSGRRLRRRRNRDNGIKLEDTAAVPPPPNYRDEPRKHRDEFAVDSDVDALGSLASSPIASPSPYGHQQQAARGGRGNAFRDEIVRQDRDRGMDL